MSHHEDKQLEAEILFLGVGLAETGEMVCDLTMPG